MANVNQEEKTMKLKVPKIGKKAKIAAFILLIFLAGLSFLPVFTDPYHSQEEPVNFWTWAWREIDELIYGERIPAEGMP